MCPAADAAVAAAPAAAATAAAAACRTVTDIYPNPQLLAAAAEAVAGLIKSSSHNLKYCGLTALAAITR
jgi:AP-4 complex subunit epsilon-1